MPDRTLGKDGSGLGLDTRLLETRVADLADLWDDMYSDADKTAKEFNQTMVEGAEQYRKKLVEIAEQLEQQRRTMIQLQELAGTPAAGADTALQAQRATVQLELERNKLQELEIQFDRTYDAMRSFLAQQNKISSAPLRAIQPQQASGAKADAGTSGSSALQSGLSVFTDTLPDAFSKLEELASRIDKLRESGSSGLSALASGVNLIGSFVAGLNLAASVVGMIAEAYQKMRAEQMLAFQEGIQQAQSYSETIRTAEANLAVLQDEASSTQEVRAARESLANLMPNLIVGYDSEGRAILAGNEQLRERLSLMREEEEYYRQKAVDNGAVYANDAGALQKQIQDLEASMAQNREWLEWSDAALMDVNPTLSKTMLEEQLKSQSEELAELKHQYREVAQEARDYYYVAVEEATGITDSNGEIITSFTNMSEQYKTAVREMLKEYDELFQGTVSEDQIQGIASDINEMLKDPELVERYAASWRKANEEAQRQADLAYILTQQYGQQAVSMETLSDAYAKLSGGVALSKEELQQLAQALPEVHSYLQQTGDLTLQSGQLLMEVQYQSYADNLNELSTAYQTLSSGQSLNLNQLEEMRSKYPQIDDYLQKTNDLTLRNGEVLREAADAQKEATVSFLENNRQQLESQIDTTQKKIEMLESEIQVYQIAAASEYASVTTQQRQEQRVTNSPKKIALWQQLAQEKEQLESTIALYEEMKRKIETIRHSTWNSTKPAASNVPSSVRKDSGLSDELKQMDHQKKMEQLNLQQELAWLKELQQKYNDLADDRMNLEYRIFSVEKEIREEQRQSVQEKLDAAYDELDQKEKLSEESIQLAQEEYRKLDALRKEYVYAPDADWDKASEAQRAYLLTKEQDLDLNARLYESQKRLAEMQKEAAQGMLDDAYGDISHEKAMDRMTAAQELELLETIQRKAEQMSAQIGELTTSTLAQLTEEQAQYVLNAEQKLELEEKIHEARKRAYQEEYQNLQNRIVLEDLSTEEQIEHLERLQRKYKNNKEIQMDLEIELYNLKKELQQEEINAIDSLAGALVEALRNRYEEQRKAEQDRIQESIGNWQTWEDETVSAIQGQIDALDELEKQEESEEKRREYEQKKQALQLQLAYEKDDYQRKQYQQELARLEKEEQERLDQEAREAERERLEEEIQKVQEESQKQQDALQQELDKINEEYDKMTSDFQLRAEAEKAIMAKTQKEIIELIQSYAPEYDLAGQSIGQKLAEGFKDKFGSVLDYVQEVTDAISNYQQTLIDQANAAADKFYQTHQKQADLPQPPASLSAAREKQVQVTVNFNQPVESPVETRRAIQSVMNEIARQIG